MKAIWSSARGPVTEMNKTMFLIFWTPEDYFWSLKVKCTVKPEKKNGQSKIDKTKFLMTTASLKKDENIAGNSPWAPEYYFWSLKVKCTVKPV